MTTPEELDGGAIDAALDASLDAPLDALDKKLLGLIQSGFPLEPRPYAVLGGQLGIGEDEALARVKSLRQRKIIRRLGANFQSAKLGYRSTLCAARVPDDKLEALVAAVNAHPGVTHNYLRAHSYNVWFTMISRDWTQLCRDLEAISALTGVKIINLPARRMYKIKVEFPMDE